MDRPSEALGIPLIMNNIGNYDIVPIQTEEYYQVPLNMNNFGSYPIMPIDSDPTPVININKISKMISTHRTMSSAFNMLAKKLPFSRVTNYIIAKNMIRDLMNDVSINLINDVDKNEYNTPVGGIDDIFASFSSTTLQKLESVGDTKEIQPDDIKEESQQQPDGKRKYFIGGNWKCNGTIKSVSELADKFSQINTSKVDVLIAPLSIHIPLVQSKFARKSNIIISSQNVSATKTGAFTGEIAAKQLQDMNVTTTLIGHSERRKYYGESNKIITSKVKMALKNKLNIVCCLGETLKERQANRVEEVCFKSLQAIADGVGYAGWDKIVIAYEPVWAIGTGVACSPSKAQETHKALRKWFNDKISVDVAQNIRIIYGGSVKPKNCKELIVQADIDGFLVGGASLKAESFSKIIKSVQNEST